MVKMMKKKKHKSPSNDVNKDSLKQFPSVNLNPSRKVQKNRFISVRHIDSVDEAKEHDIVRFQDKDEEEEEDSDEEGEISTVRVIRGEVELIPETLHTGMQVEKMNKKQQRQSSQTSTTGGGLTSGK